MQVHTFTNLLSTPFPEAIGTILQILLIWSTLYNRTVLRGMLGLLSRWATLLRDLMLATLTMETPQCRI